MHNPNVSVSLFAIWDNKQLNVELRISTDRQSFCRIPPTSTHIRPEGGRRTNAESESSNVLLSYYPSLIILISRLSLDWIPAVFNQT